MSDTTITRQIRLERRLRSYWRVTFDHPPLNIFGPETIPQLNEIIARLETDEEVKVVVFDSAVEGFFLTHYDFLAKLEDSTSLPPGPTGLQALPDMLARLSRAPVVSIVSINGKFSEKEESRRSRLSKKELNMTEIKKVVYTAKTHTTGGRDGGASRTSDGRLDVKLSLPGGPGIGTNPRFTAKRVGRPSALRWRLSVPSECIRTRVHEESAPYST